ncbi:MAG: CoA pyrophosphatase [Saprospiraceae bacterium]|nr:CoA pyrophosphatase [Saprospiraceae bacterium]
MQFQRFIENFEFNKFESHRKMAPLPNRLLELAPKNVKKAGVVILLYECSGELVFPLIKRTSTNKNDPHAGQISLPGGRYDIADGSLLNTALRETEEEIGIRLLKKHVIASLSSLYIPVSQNEVHPFIAFIDEIPQFKNQPSEVESIIQISLNNLLEPRHSVRKVLNTSYAQNIEVPGFEIESHWIWGATAMILQEFLDIYKKFLN